MTNEPRDIIESQIAAHAAVEAEDVARLRAMSIAERARMIESACRAAAVALQERAAAGAPPVKPIPWPQSTWEFLRTHAARVRSQATH
jgi:hypothetical protein